MEPIRIDKYTVVSMEERGQYGFSLYEGWINRDDEFKPNFCKREFGGKDSKTEKTVPVSVKLGSAEQVKEIALAMLLEATGERYAPVVNGPHREQPVDDGDCPF